MRNVTTLQLGVTKLLISVSVVVLILSINSHSQPVNKITILVDSFGKGATSQMDWGYSALIEYNGKRILFDTGNNSNNFAANVLALAVDLTTLDCVVISHRHGDHTAGLRYLANVAPKVKIYTPVDEYFGGATPPVFFRQPDASLPLEMRYFGGSPPETIPHGSAWQDMTFVQVEKLTEVAPGIRLIPTTSRTPGFMDLKELSLSVQTPDGQVLLVGCSHSGIEPILEKAVSIDKKVRILAGGLHLLNTSDAEVERLASALHEKWQIAQIAPGHCTGERAFAILRRKFGTRYTYAGVRSTIIL